MVIDLKKVTRRAQQQQTSKGGVKIKIGRPPKDKVDLHLTISKDIRVRLEKYIKKLKIESKTRLVESLLDKAMEDVGL